MESRERTWAGQGEQGGTPLTVLDEYRRALQHLVGHSRQTGRRAARLRGGAYALVRFPLRASESDPAAAESASAAAYLPSAHHDGFGPGISGAPER